MTDEELDELEKGAIADEAVHAIETSDLERTLALVAEVRRMRQQARHVVALVDRLGEPEWRVLSGAEFLGPGWHVVEAEGNTYSLNLGSMYAPAAEKTRERAEQLRDLFEYIQGPMVEAVGR